MNEQTILIPFIHPGEIIESKPHKIILSEDHLETWHYSKVKEEDEELSIQKEIFRDVQSVFIKKDISLVERFFCNKSKMYVVEFGGRTTYMSIYFSERSFAVEFYATFKEWLVAT